MLERTSERILSAFANFFVIFEVFLAVFWNLKGAAKTVSGQKGVRWIDVVEIYLERS